MGIRIDFGKELGAVDFPDDMTEEQVKAYVQDNHKEIRAKLIANRGADAALDTEAEELGRYSRGEMPVGEFVGSAVAQGVREAKRITGRALQGAERAMEMVASNPTAMTAAVAALGPAAGAAQIAGAMGTKALRPDGELPVEQRAGFKVGERIVESSEEEPVLPGAESSITGQVAGGIGSVAALAPYAVTGPAAPFVAGGVYGASAGEEAYQEAIATIDARIAKSLAQGDNEMAATLERQKHAMAEAAFMATAPIGAITEGALGVAGKLRVTQEGLKLAAKKGIVERIVGNFVERAGVNRLPEWAARRVEGAAEGMATEAAQETLEQVLGNAAAQLTYDPTRKLSEGALQSAMIGGLTGAAVGGVVGTERDDPAALPATRAAVEQSTPPAAAEAAEAETSEQLTEADVAGELFEQPPTPPAAAATTEVEPPQGRSVAEVEQTEPDAGPPAPEPVEVEPPAVTEQPAAPTQPAAVQPEPQPTPAEPPAQAEEAPAPAAVEEPPAPVEPPARAEEEPPAAFGTTRRFNIGKTRVEVAFPDELHALLFDVPSQWRRGAAGEIPAAALEQTLERLKKRFGFKNQQEVMAAVDEYRAEVMRLAKDSPNLKAPEFAPKPAPAPAPAPSEKPASGVDLEELLAALYQRREAQAAAPGGVVDDRLEQQIRQVEAALAEAEEGPAVTPPPAAPEPTPAPAPVEVEPPAAVPEAPIETDEPAKKAAEEEAEAKMVRQTRETIRNGIALGNGSRAIYDSLVGLYESAKKLRTRTSTSKTNQAYSTPPPLAFIAQRLANVFGGTVLAESSAGNGMLLTGITQKQRVLANELDPNRRGRLTAFLKRNKGEAAEATGLDATSDEYHALLMKDRPDRVVINPPFGAVFKDGEKQRFKIRNPVNEGSVDTPSVDLAIAFNTLDAMTDDGKAVLILGAKTGSQSATMGTDESRAKGYKRHEYLELFKKYNVTDIFTVDGKLYEGMGAGWPVDVVVIDGKRPTPAMADGGFPRPWMQVPRVYKSWEELSEVLNEKNPTRRPGGGAGTPAGAETQRGPDAPAAPGTQPRVDSPPPGGSGAAGSGTGRTRAPKPTGVEPGGDRPPGGGAPAVEPQPAPAQPTQGTGPVGEQGAPAGGAPAGPTPAVTPGILSTLSAEKQKRAEELKARLRDKLQQVGALVDPEILIVGAELAGLYVEAGARRFIDFARQVRTDMPEIWDRLKGSLLPIWQETANTYPDLDDLTRAQASGAIIQIEQEIAEQGSQPENPADPATPEAKEPEMPEPVPPAEGEQGLTAPYVSASKAPDVGIVTPVNIAGDQRRALADLEREIGMSVDKFVSERLQIPEGLLYQAFSGPQIDAVALAIRNIERGSALINSDQTGVGKGRTAAAIIRYAKLRGLIPVFITAKPTLYTDMLSRDLPDMGETGVNPVVTNTTVTYKNSAGEEVKVSRAKAQRDAMLNAIGDTGQLPPGTNALFTTYDQLNHDVEPGFDEDAKAKRARKSKRQPKPPGPALRALGALAPNAIFVMDEAHLAAGPDSDLNMSLSRILPNTAGAYYLSATFAKRPDNLGFYAIKSLMQKAGLKAQEMADALKAGGLALQQALTSMLAQSGEYVRRETNVKGLTFEFKTVTQDREREREMADTYVEFLRDLLKLNKEIRGMAKRMTKEENQESVEGTKVRVEATNFGSLLFQISKQYLLAMRANAIGDYAVESLKAGEKPFIVVENTMEGVMEKLKEGSYELSFRGVLQRQLAKMLEFKRKSGGKTEVITLTPEQLSDRAREMYYALEDAIQTADLGDMPISPIDRIKGIVRDAGFTIGEITGRNTETEEGEGGAVTSKPRKGGGSSDPSKRNRETLEQYNNGELDAVIANKSGSTGVSAHAAPKFKDTPGHKKRRMIIGQPLGDINDFIQMIGRVNRFGQLIAPAYTILQSSLSGEKRFMVMLRRKLASLNAATSADTDSEFTQTEGLPEDIFNVVGDDVVSKVLQSHPDLALEADIDADFDPESSDLSPGEFALKATGKFILLNDEDQKQLWEEIGDLYKSTIAALDAVGENPLKATVDDLRAKTVRTAEFTEGVGDTVFDGPSVLEEADIKPPSKPPTYEEAVARASEGKPKAVEELREWVRASERAEAARVATMRQKEMPEEQIARTQTVFEEVRAAVVQAASLIGRPFVDANGFVGIPYGLNLEAKGPANFTRASDHQILVTKNKVRANLPLAISQVETNTEGNPGVLGKPVEGDPADSWNLSMEDSARRYIVTGNLLRGYKAARSATQFRPQVTVFTTAAGSRRTGIVMPSSYKPDAPKRGLETTNEMQAVTLVQNGTRVYVNEGDSDRSAAILKPSADKKTFSFAVRASGQYRPIWSDPAVTGITGTMTQNGTFFASDPIPMEKAASLLSRLKALGVGGWKYDAVEKALNWAIAKTQPDVGLYDFTKAIPMTVINLALKAARAVYVATRDYVQARRAAMAYVEANTAEGTDLSGVPVMLDNLMAGGASFDGPVTPPKASSGIGRVESRGRFAGTVTKDTEKGWDDAASEWIGQFDGDIEQAFRVAIGANAEADFGIDAAIRQVILGQILELSEARVTFARNDIATMRALRFQQEVADALRQSGAQEFGKTGRARQFALKQMEWLMPVLTHRNLIRERQNQIPIDEELTDRIRLWMLDVTQRAVKNLRQSLSSADNLVQRELRKAARELGVSWYDIMTASLAKQGAFRRNLFNVIAKHPILKDLDPKSRLVLTNLVADAFEKERARIVRAEFAKEVPLPNVRKDTRDKLHQSIPQIIKWANLGILTNPAAAAEAFRNAIAPRFGVAQFDGPTAQKVVDLAQRAQAVGGVNRRRLIQQMYEVMKEDGGVRKRDIITDYWYSAVLSGIRTQVDQVTSILNGMANTVLASVRNPGAAPYMASAFWDGLRMGGADFLPIVLRGERFRSINFNPELPTSALESLRKSDSLAMRAIAQMSYVSRLQDAVDHIGSIATNQAMIAWTLYRGQSLDALREFMTPTEADLALATEKAQIERTPPDLMRRRVREILAERIPSEVVLDAHQIALEVSSKQTPKGIGGLLYQSIQTVLGKYPELKMATGLAFARFAINFTNMQLNYTPIGAAWRWWASGPGVNTRFAYPLTEGQRSLLVMQGAAGTTAAALLAATILGDDDDGRERQFDITGSFKGLDPKKRAQLLSEGRQPYSFRVGSTYISYRQLPGAMAIAAIGELRDRQLHEPQNWNEESLLRKTADGVMAGMFIVKDSPAVSALMETFGFANAYKYDMDSVIERDAPKFFAKLAGSFIPNIAKEIDAWTDPAIYKANTGGEYFVQQVPYLRREVGAGPMLNVLGEPVTVERLPWSRWVKERKEDKAWTTLGTLANRGVFLPMPAATMTVRKDGKREKATPEQVARYQKETGKLYRAFIEANSEKLLAAEPEVAAKMIDRATSRLRARARELAKLQPED